MRVLFLPAYKNADNPYLQLLTNSLDEFGVKTTTSWTFPGLCWLFQHIQKVDILHIHWPSYLYHFNKLTWLRSVIVLIRFLVARGLGYKIVWTAHNLKPHDSVCPWTDRFFRKLIIKFGHGVIFHCIAAYYQVSETYGFPSNYAIIPHGNYDGFYPSLPDKLEVRSRLGIPSEQFVYLCFGKVRGYKGIDRLIEDFKKLGAPNSSLIIAGMAEQDDKARLIVQYKKEKNILLFLHHIDDADVSKFLAVADVVISPYTSILTSGVALLALTFGRPMIAPRLGCLPELVTHSCGILYDPEDSSGLLDALNNIQSADLGAMSIAARKRAEEYKWDDIGRLTADFYRKCVGK